MEKTRLNESALQKAAKEWVVLAELELYRGMAESYVAELQKKVLRLYALLIEHVAFREENGEGTLERPNAAVEQREVCFNKIRDTHEFYAGG